MGLPEHEVVNHIQILASHIKCSNQALWETQFKKALVRMIACAFGEDVNRVVMVLYQPKQNTGKSQFIRNLCPWRTKQYYTESPISGNQKDGVIRMSENFIWNLEELEGMMKKDVSSIKAMLSNPITKERRPYQMYEDYQTPSY